jgi:putative membrane protein insertion efficiency factor
MKKVVLYLIHIYRTYFSPFLPPSCRFSPTCSQYAQEAITRYGLARGGWLSIKRLSKCHPFHAGGYDPVESFLGREQGGTDP